MNRIFDKLRHYYSVLGLKGVFAFCLTKLLGRRAVFAAQVPGIKFPVYVRLATTDVSVLKQVLMEKHYDFPLSFSPTTIIDAGANIGLSAVFFANRFPDARILAIEPEHSNYQLLVRNTAAYPQVQPIQAALWHSEGSISLLDPGSGNHGFQTSALIAESKATDNLVRATTVKALMRDNRWETVDLLKLDIEGSEKEVFDSSSSWIAQTRAIMVELHEHLKPGCEGSFATATREFKDGGRCGESLMVFREPFQSATI